MEQERQKKRTQKEEAQASSEQGEEGPDSSSAVEVAGKGEGKWSARGEGDQFVEIKKRPYAKKSAPSQRQGSASTDSAEAGTGGDLKSPENSTGSPQERQPRRERGER